MKEYLDTNNQGFKNIESPFTELFSLLKRSEDFSNTPIPLAYSSNELMVIQQHADNAIDLLLHGMQDLGRLLGIVMQENSEIIKEVNNIGFLISVTSNLTEALSILRLDVEHILRQRDLLGF